MLLDFRVNPFLFADLTRRGYLEPHPWLQWDPEQVCGTFETISALTFCKSSAKTKKNARLRRELFIFLTFGSAQLTRSQGGLRVRED